MLKNMDPVKLELIRSAASKTKGKSGKALAPVMMALITSANKKGIRFTPDDAWNAEKIKKWGLTKFPLLSSSGAPLCEASPSPIPPALRLW